MKIFKRLFVGLFIFITLVVILYFVWRLLLWRDDRRNMELGNSYVANIESYRQQYNKLPDERDRDTLARLNPDPKGEYLEARAAWPMYEQIETGHFTLTFLEGFDGPYLTYDSRTKVREMR